VSTPPATAPLRIGDVARLAGTTPRTIRYYEEIGLLEPAGDRSSGQHRVYTEADVERLREILRFRDLLGVTLDELKDLMAAEDARAAIRVEFRRAEDPAHRRRLLEEALGHLDRQLALVQRRARGRAVRAARAGDEAAGGRAGGRRSYRRQDVMSGVCCAEPSG
jgi:DNA-binding transcriptional MerR regulator